MNGHVRVFAVKYYSAVKYVYIFLFWNSPCCIGWPQIHRALPASAGIKIACHHAQLHLLSFWVYFVIKNPFNYSLFLLLLFSLQKEVVMRKFHLLVPRHQNLPSVPFYLQPSACCPLVPDPSAFLDMLMWALSFSFWVYLHHSTTLPFPAKHS